MSCTESILSKLNKDDLIGIVLDMQKNQNSILSDMKNELPAIKNELSEIRKNCNKQEVYLKVSKSVTEAMNKHIIVLQSKCWSNNQHSRRECLKIFGIPSDTEGSELEETVLKVFEKLDVDFDPKNCHWKIVTGLKLEIVVRKW